MNALEPPASVLSKLGSIAVHAEELFSKDGHNFDKIALQSLIEDEEVQVWLFSMTELAMLPVKR